MINGGMSGAGVQTRSFLKNVRRDDESGSIQRLLDGVGGRSSGERVAIPIARMNRSDARACVCAMWSYYVRAKDYGGAASIELFDSLVGGSGSASELLVDYVERNRVAGEENRLYASLATRSCWSMRRRTRMRTRPGPSWTRTPACSFFPMALVAPGPPGTPFTLWSGARSSCPRESMSFST